MIKNLSTKLLKGLFLIFIAFAVYFPLGAYADTPTPTPAPNTSPTPTPEATPIPDNSQKVKDLQNKINDLQNKISDLQGQEKTLSSQIAVMDGQIKLILYKIEATKDQITELEQDIGTATKKISGLESSLDNLTKVLMGRIVATYEIGTVQPFQVLLSSSTVTNFFSRLNYLKVAQAHDKRLIYDTTQAKNDYSNQKTIYEDKKSQVETLQKQLEGYNNQLAQEKKGKQQLLELTQNDEQNYQDMLARTRAEYQAILGISAGYGSETEIGDVSEGDRVASIIPGASACSNGTHLHFEIHNGGTVNPASYLSPQEVDWDLCGWFGCDSSFSFTGSWRWPLNGKPKITQPYGTTAYAKTGAYGGAPHTGIDMVSNDLSVIAVKSGKLFRGSIRCGGGYLRYVKVKQSDGIDSLYLHVNY